MNINQISKIKLSPNIIECIVFWTKDPSKDFIEKLSILNNLGYKYYFQYTLNPYNKKLELNLPNENDRIKKFINLSERIGKQKVIWRYDPIIINDNYTLDYQNKNFHDIAEKLSNYTEKCIISFVDIYKKIQTRLSQNNIYVFDNSTIKTIAKMLSEISKQNKIRMDSCCEQIDLSDFGIKHGHCIDCELVNKIVGKEYNFKKDKTQRDVCGCITSVDIGSYNTCQHKCIYCYANWIDTSNALNKYDINSPLLCSEVESNDKITERIVQKCDLLEKELFN
ncbi:hypothetical protein FACS1894110_13810 [Spirochaetia bacterium]|nr:hypothetical protein FACS1894110_13810 [Spirochaetia bacterium]